jgi:hypothetical protein
MDQDQALLLVAIADAGALLSSLSPVTLSKQTSQALLTLVNWRLNRTLVTVLTDFSAPKIPRKPTSLPSTPSPSSLSTSFQLTAASAIFVSQAGSSKEDSQHLRPSPSTEGYDAKAHRMQQHRQRLQDHRKFKLLEFSMLYSRCTKAPRARDAGLLAQDFALQDEATALNIQHFISQAIRRASGLVKQHEQYKELCSSVEKLSRLAQPAGHPFLLGPQHKEPDLRLVQDQEDAQYAVFDSMD